MNFFSLFSSQKPVEEEVQPQETHIKIGDYVSANGKYGTVKYIGDFHLAPGTWVGLELDEAKGKHDGWIEGTRYFRCAPYHGSMVKLELCEYVGKAPSAATNDLNDSVILNEFGDDLNSTIVKQDEDEIEQILKETNPEDENDSSLYSNSIASYSKPTTSSSSQQQQKRGGGEAFDFTDLFKKPTATKKIGENKMPSRFGSSNNNNNNNNGRISLSSAKSTVLPNSASKLSSNLKSSYSSSSVSSNTSQEVKNLKDELTKTIQERMDLEQLLDDRVQEINNLTQAYSEMQSEFEKLKYDHDKMEVEYDKLKRLSSSTTTTSNMILQLQQQVDQLKTENKRLTQENLVLKQANKEKNKLMKENNLNSTNNNNSNSSLNDSITSKTSTTPSIGTINRFSSSYFNKSTTSSNTPSALGNTKSYSAINTSTPSVSKWKNF